MKTSGSCWPSGTLTPNSVFEKQQKQKSTSNLSVCTHVFIRISICNEPQNHHHHKQQPQNWFEDHSPAESERTIPPLDAVVDYNQEDSTATASRAFVLTVSTGFVAKNHNILSRDKPSADETGLFSCVMKSTS